jgi:hypothetical protein
MLPEMRRKVYFVQQKIEKEKKWREKKKLKKRT